MQDHLISLIILIKQRTLVVHGSRSDLHLDSMLLGRLLDLLEMLVITVLGKPSDDILVGPVNLESVRVLIVDMVLLR